MESPADPTPPAALPDAPSTAAAESVSADPAPAATAPTPSPAVPVKDNAPGDVIALVASARVAQPAWASRSVEERVRILMSARDRVLDRSAALAAEVSRETGKPEVEVLVAEILPSAEVVDYWARSMEELIAPVEVELDGMAYPKKSAWTFREPRGVIGVITPWSYPVLLPFRTIVPALLAGNSVVWKPSEVAQATGALVAGLFAGLLPPGVLEVVYGGGELGEALAAADVDLIVFAGNVAAGRKVARACAERLSPCVLDLGGKDAAIVLADADLERAANGIVWGALTAAGQSPSSIERVYVEGAVATAFVERVKTEVAALRVGIDVGSLATEEGRARAVDQVSAAEKAGGQIAAGEAPKDRTAAPIVVRVESDATPLMTEPTRAPVIPIAVIADVEEAVARVNGSKYGLTASIWSKDIPRAEAVAQRLHVGTVTINNHGLTGAIPALPWSGFGDSGYGVSGSPLALDHLTRPRVVLSDASTAKREGWWYPYTPGLRQVAASTALLRSGSTGILRRVRAFFALLGGFVKRFSK